MSVKRICHILLWLFLTNLKMFSLSTQSLHPNWVCNQQGGLTSTSTGRPRYRMTRWSYCVNKYRYTSYIGIMLEKYWEMTFGPYRPALVCVCVCVRVCVSRAILVLASEGRRECESYIVNVCGRHTEINCVKKRGAKKVCVLMESYSQ